MKKPEAPRISETEWEVMRAVWAGPPATAGEILDRLAAGDPSWHPKTLQTLLTRLVKKGALEFERRGRTHVYAARVAEQECVRTETRSFVERVFGGAVKPLLAHFVEHEELSAAEMKELEELLARRRQRRR